MSKDITKQILKANNNKNDLKNLIKLNKIKNNERLMKKKIIA